MNAIELFGVHVHVNVNNFFICSRKNLVSSLLARFHNRLNIRFLFILKVLKQNMQFIWCSSFCSFQKCWIHLKESTEKKKIFILFVELAAWFEIRINFVKQKKINKTIWIGFKIVQNRSENLKERRNKPINQQLFYLKRQKKHIHKNAYANGICI